MMYVICFYWQGERWQETDFDDKGGFKTFERHLKKAGKISHDLPSRYVNNLYWGVKRFSTKEFKFVCYTNEPITEGLDPGVEIRPLKQVTDRGVLPRIYMFSEEAGLFGHQVLCLDIDVVITGSLKNFMEYEGLFCARSNFRPANETRIDGDIMSFKACKETEDVFWKPFIKDIKRAERITMGRERFWIRHAGEHIAELWDKYASGQIWSYKRHLKNRNVNTLPSKVRIVSCHGVPRPHQIKDKWIKEYWK
jgi:hypothetical protein